MKKKIGAMLCICLLTGLVSSCGSEENSLTENSSAAAFVGSSEPETAGRTDSGNDRPLVTEESAGEITLPEKEPEFWGAEYILEIEFGYGNIVTQEDIIHIGQCSYLKRLQIGIDESLTDLSSLANLTELESLNITIMDSPDLSFLRNLTQLKELSILASDEVDFSPIGSLTGLRRLEMSSYVDNSSDLSFLKNLNQLTDITFIKWCEVKDLSYFQDIQCLQNLYVTYVDDVDLNYLSKLKNLEILTITGENVRNLEGISNLINLKELYLSDNNWRLLRQEKEPLDLRPLKNLTQLEWLSLECIHLDDITPLADLESLRGVHLVNTNVEDISPLIDLENLNWLYIFGNQSELVKEQAETYFSEIKYLTVTEEMPPEY